MKNRLFTGFGDCVKPRKGSARRIALLSCGIAGSLAVLDVAPYDRVRMGDVSVEECYVGTPVKVTMNVVNWSLHSVEVLGSADTCGPDGCIEATFHRQTIPALSSSALLFNYEPAKSGEFRKEVQIYLDQAGQVTLTGWLSGHAK
jgi:hypothetical protein